MPAFVVVVLAMLLDGGRGFVENLASAIGPRHVVEGMEGWIKTSRKRVEACVLLC